MPKILGELYITGDAPFYHTQPLSVECKFKACHVNTSLDGYDGEKEGESIVQWERAEGHGEYFVPVASTCNYIFCIDIDKEAVSKLFTPSVNGILSTCLTTDATDINCTLRAICTPVREDWVKGSPVISSNRVFITLGTTH